MVPRDLTGLTFGRLTVKWRGSNVGAKVAWFCLCECGNTCNVVSDSLLCADTRSCGCLAHEELIERNTTHGLSDTSEYGIWSSMKSRCNNPNTENYERYGGRGIKVCDRWMNSFEDFITDMGFKPTNEYSLDRIDNDKDYMPGNCRWATREEQARNKSTSTLHFFDGKDRTIAEISELTGINAGTLSTRLSRGYTIDEAVSKEIKPYELNGVKMNLKEIASAIGVPYKTLHARISRGSKVEDAIKHYSEIYGT